MKILTPVLCSWFGLQGEIFAVRSTYTETELYKPPVLSLLSMKGKKEMALQVALPRVT